FDPKTEVLVDPLAGSGTLLVEAGLMAAGKPLWMSGRQPAYREFPGGAPTYQGKPPALFADTRPALFGAEADSATYDAFLRASETAGVMGQMNAFEGDFREDIFIEGVKERAEERAIVVLSNPPYGERLNVTREELGNIYADLREFCHRVGADRAGFIVGQRRERETSTLELFQRAFGGRPRIKKPMNNGPLQAQFFLYDFSS
ncbi:MAG: hypothetical protein MK135_16995, partial [Polyangiaceae bacterium]|nr:hypothetical protein [Polyangiaceae bacterium]